MRKKTYKQKYEELLDQPDTDKKINKHTKGYIHVSWSSVGRFAALFGSIALAILNFILIISIGNTLKVWEMLSTYKPPEAYASYSQLLILYPLIGGYFLIGLVLICFVALVRVGFDKINIHTKGEVIAGVVTGGIIGVAVGGIIGGIAEGGVGVVAGGIIGVIIGGIVGVVVGQVVLILGGGIGLIDYGEN